MNLGERLQLFNDPDGNQFALSSKVDHKMTKPVARKLGLNPGTRALIMAPPPGYLKLLTPPDGLKASSKAEGIYPFVQIFAARLSEINKFMD